MYTVYIEKRGFLDSESIIICLMIIQPNFPLSLLNKFFSSNKQKDSLLLIKVFNTKIFFNRSIQERKGDTNKAL